MRLARNKDRQPVEVNQEQKYISPEVDKAEIKQMLYENQLAKEREEHERMLRM